MSKEANLTTITVNKLGKAFTMHSKKRERIKEIFGYKTRHKNQYWALRDINFQLKKGEAIGVIGKNGSGKSTLLQIICGTLTATEGRVETQGRIAALLELGSGFSPEFTGRENIYLNATLLGLKRKEIENNLDNILGFADIGNFIDQPIRTYSSGMIVRLAFSIIAHVNADILIVDEALAVGDAYFTQKCMRFIQRMREEKSLMFVSHDANAVLSLCDKAILLDKGKMMKLGSPKEIIEVYTRELQEEMSQNKTGDKSGMVNDEQAIRRIKESWTSESRETYKLKWQDYRKELINETQLANILTIKKFDQKELQYEDYEGSLAKIEAVTLTNIETDHGMNVIMGGELVSLEIVIKTYGYIKSPIIGFLLKNDKGVTLVGENSFNTFRMNKIKNLDEGMKIRTTFAFTIPLLPSGDYSITASVADGDQKQHKILHWKNDAIVLQSQCSSIAAGLAGIPMHSIIMETF